MFGLPHWQLKSTSTEAGVVAPDERLPLGQTMVMGVQHAVAMFGATVLMPMLMGLDPNLAILMSGMGTLLFFFVTGGRVPSYLGSSAAFVGVVIAATGFNGQGINPNLSVALGGIIACGLVYTLIGALVLWYLTVGAVRGFAFFLGLPLSEAVQLRAGVNHKDFFA